MASFSNDSVTTKGSVNGGSKTITSGYYIAPNSTLYLMRTGLSPNSLDTVSHTDTSQINWIVANTLYQRTKQYYQRGMLDGRNYVRTEFDPTGHYNSMGNLEKESTDWTDVLSVDYLVFVNSDFEGKYVCAFVTGAEYINNLVVEYTFEVDYVQTFYNQIVNSSGYINGSYFLQRYTPPSDGFFEHTVPEEVTGDTYIISDVYRTENVRCISLQDTSETTRDFDNILFGSANDYINNWNNEIVCCSALADETLEQLGVNEASYGIVYEKTPAGVLYHAYSESNGLALYKYIRDLEQQGKTDEIISLDILPSFMAKPLEDAEAGFPSSTNDTGTKIQTLTTSGFYPPKYLGSMSRPNAYGNTSYTPHNFKLYTGQYVNIMVSDMIGKAEIYTFSDFTRGRAQFAVYGTATSIPEMCVIPLNHNGMEYDVKDFVQTTSFAQSAFTSDTFKVWKAQNQASIFAGYASGIYTSAVGVVQSGIPGHYAQGLGTSSSAISQLLSTWASVEDAKAKPNEVKGNQAANLMQRVFSYMPIVYVQTITSDMAETIDNYFTMFGYQVNDFYSINLTGRKHFVYFNTVNAKVTGIDNKIPASARREIEKRFDSGIRFWRYRPNISDAVDIGDYEKDWNYPQRQSFTWQGDSYSNNNYGD